MTEKRITPSEYTEERIARASAKTITVATRIPGVSGREIEEYAEQNGLTRSDVLRMALVRFLAAEVTL